MRRVHDRRPERLFRGSELPRLMTMIVMLGVLYMLIDRAQDTSTWTALVGKSTAEDSSTIHAEDFPENQQSQPPKKQPRQKPAKAPTAAPPPVETRRTETVAAAPAAEASKAEPLPADAALVETPPPEARAAKPPIVEAPTAETPAAEAAPPEAAPAADGLAADVPPPEAAEVEPPPAKAPVDEAADVPNDLDPAEQEAAKREFEAVFDKETLSPFEMPAYWRLYKWAKSQSPQAMRARGRRDLLFTHLWERPAQYRGQLIRLHLLHLRRILSYELPADVHPGVHRVYEGWGFTDESGTNFYLVVFPELPKGMPLGPDVHEDVTFTGYFLKLMPYVAVDAKQRGVPLLIGRVIWHPAAKAAQSKGAEWQWGLMIGGAVIALLVLLQWLPNRLRSKDNRARPSRLASGTGDEDAVPIDDWLEQAETPETPQTLESLEYADGHTPNGSPGINGNGAPGLHPDRLDGSKDPDG